MVHELGAGLSGPIEDRPTDEDGGSYRRVLVPIESPQSSPCVLALAAGIRHPIDGVIRFIHIRIWDPPVRGDGKFYPETSQEAHAVVEDALIAALARDVEATGTVVEAQRSEVAAAILSESAVWGSDVIVLSQRRRRTLSLTPLGSVNRRVMRGATCPVLLTHQGRR